jgi:hypothetical protein
MRISALRIGLEFKLADMWVGIYWRRGCLELYGQRYDAWICVLPCLPVHVRWWTR